MTDGELIDARRLVERLRSSAKAFRDHPIYDSEGDGVFLTVQAEELECAADLIEAQSATIARLNAEVERMGEAIESALAHRYGAWTFILDAALAPKEG